MQIIHCTYHTLLSHQNSITIHVSICYQNLCKEQMHLLQSFKSSSSFGTSTIVSWYCYVPVFLRKFKWKFCNANEVKKIFRNGRNLLNVLKLENTPTAYLFTHFHHIFIRISSIQQNFHFSFIIFHKYHFHK